MYGIFTYICHKFIVNVGKYAIYGWCGNYIFVCLRLFPLTDDISVFSSRKLKMLSGDARGRCGNLVIWRWNTHAELSSDQSQWGFFLGINYTLLSTLMIQSLNEYIYIYNIYDWLFSFSQTLNVGIFTLAITVKEPGWLGVYRG